MPHYDPNLESSVPIGFPLPVRILQRSAAFHRELYIGAANRLLRPIEF